MGIFTEKFVEDQTQLDVFMCPICHEIVEDPVVPQCVCQAIYCKSCVDDWLKDHQLCPHCGYGQINHSSTMAIGRMLRKAYDNLKMKCDTPGCDVPLTIKDHESHKEACPKIPWKCDENCGLEANLSVKAGHKCTDWLKSERLVLIHDLEQVRTKCKELETELEEECKAKNEMENVLAEKNSLIESIKSDHAKEMEQLRQEILIVRKQLVHVNKERDKLHMELDQILQQNQGKAYHDEQWSLNNNSDNRKSVDENIEGRIGLNSTLNDDTFRQLAIDDVVSGDGLRRQMGRGGARERKTSVESTRSERFSSRRPPQNRKPAAWLANTDAGNNSSNDSGVKKVIEFKKITKANEEIKSKVTSAVNEADSKGLRGLQFKKEVAIIMGRLVPCRGGNQWICYSSDLFDANRAKMKRETFCSFTFGPTEYYVYERIWYPDRPPPAGRTD